jgi:hypothetical protein
MAKHVYHISATKYNTEGKAVRHFDGIAVSYARIMSPDDYQRLKAEAFKGDNLVQWCINNLSYLGEDDGSV